MKNIQNAKIYLLLAVISTQFYSIHSYSINGYPVDARFFKDDTPNDGVLVFSPAPSAYPFHSLNHVDGELPKADTLLSSSASNINPFHPLDHVLNNPKLQASLLQVLFDLDPKKLGSYEKSVREIITSETVIENLPALEVLIDGMETDPKKVKILKDLLDSYTKIIREQVQ